MRPSDQRLHGLAVRLALVASSVVVAFLIAEVGIRLAAVGVETDAVQKDPAPAEELPELKARGFRFIRASAVVR